MKIILKKNIISHYSKSHISFEIGTHLPRPLMNCHKIQQLELTQKLEERQRGSNTQVIGDPEEEGKVTEESQKNTQNYNSIKSSYTKKSDLNCILKEHIMYPRILT